MKKQINLLLNSIGVFKNIIIRNFRFSTKENVGKNLGKESNLQENIKVGKTNLEKKSEKNISTNKTEASKNAIKQEKNNDIVNHEDYFDLNNNPIKNDEADKLRKNRIMERLDQFQRDNNFRDKLFYLKYQWSKIQRDKIQYNLNHISNKLNVYQQQECDAMIKILSSFKKEETIIFNDEAMKHLGIPNKIANQVPAVFDPNFPIYQEFLSSLLPFIVSGHFIGGVSNNVNKSESDTKVEENKAKEAKKVEEPVKKVEKTHVDIKLVSFDQAKKITLIKEVKTIFNLGLKESKEAVEKTDDFLKKGVKIEEAKEIQQKLEAFGAKIELL